MTQAEIINGGRAPGNFVLNPPRASRKGDIRRELRHSPDVPLDPPLLKLLSPAAQGRSYHHRVALMKKRKTLRSRRKPTQDEIDRFVTAQADDDSAWEKAIVVRRPKTKFLSIPAELAARAAFLAKLHRESRVDKWVERIVRERVEIEESAFTAARKNLAT
jgi:hypothetical protein